MNCDLIKRDSIFKGTHCETGASCDGCPANISAESMRQCVKKLIMRAPGVRTTLPMKKVMKLKPEWVRFCEAHHIAQPTYVDESTIAEYYDSMGEVEWENVPLESLIELSFGGAIVSKQVLYFKGVEKGKPTFSQFDSAEGAARGNATYSLIRWGK
jgi:hypothetical protein